MTREEIDRIWAHPSNWSLVYRCARDPRVIVPRRRPWTGWTINFAHPLAWFAVVFAVAIAVGPFIGLLLIGVGSPPLLIAVLIASIILLVGFSHWEASRSRE